MDACLNTLFLRIIYLGKTALTIVKFAVPGILIIKIVIDLYKNMITTDNKTLPNIKNKIIAAFIVFIVPTVIDLVMNLLVDNYKDSNNALITCYEFANLEYIKTIEEQKDKEELELYLTEREKALEESEKMATAIRKLVESNKAKVELGNYANNKNKLKCGTASQYNTNLFNVVRSAGYKTREGVVAAALYLSSQINVHIPYFWSGGHFHTYSGYKDKGNNFIGLSDKWGCSVKMMSPGTGKQKANQSYPFGLDCSGFVAWAIFNGGYYTGDSNQTIVISTNTPGSISGTDSSSKPQVVSFSSSKGKLKAGDILYRSGHVAMVIKIDGNTVKIAEEKGADYGLIVTTLKYGGGGFSHAILMDNFYKNYKKDAPLYSGFK